MLCSVIENNAPRLRDQHRVRNGITWQIDKTGSRNTSLQQATYSTKTATTITYHWQTSLLYMQHVNRLLPIQILR